MQFYISNSMCYNLYDDQLADNRHFSLRQFKGHQAKRILQAHQDYVHIVLRINKQVFISCSNNGEVKVWNSKSWRALRNIKLFQKRILTIVRYSLSLLLAGGLD